jgi:hypothetical protein
MGGVCGNTDFLGLRWGKILLTVQGEFGKIADNEAIKSYF